MYFISFHPWAATPTRLIVYLLAFRFQMFIQPRQMTRPYKFLLFDADGTLYDFAAAQTAALKDSWEILGIPYNDSTTSGYLLRNEALWLEFEKDRITIEDLQIKRFVDFLQDFSLPIDPVFANRTMVEQLSRHGELYPESLEILTELKRRNYDISLCTNGIHEVQWGRMHSPETKGIYSDVFTPKITGSHKPHKGFFEYVFREKGITDRSQVVMIGDGLSSDIQGGINAGIDTVWYNPTKKSSGNLTPTYEIADLRALLDLFPPRE
jgi:YjjG family noncanonical pyrimidine nucleotidase